MKIIFDSEVDKIMRNARKEKFGQEVIGMFLYCSAFITLTILIMSALLAIKYFDEDYALILASVCITTCVMLLLVQNGII